MASVVNPCCLSCMGRISKREIDWKGWQRVPRRRSLNLGRKFAMWLEVRLAKHLNAATTQLSSDYSWAYPGMHNCLGTIICILKILKYIWYMPLKQVSRHGLLSDHTQYMYIHRPRKQLNPKCWCHRVMTATDEASKFSPHMIGLRCCLTSPSYFSISGVEADSNTQQAKHTGKNGSIRNKDQGCSSRRRGKAKLWPFRSPLGTLRSFRRLEAGLHRCASQAICNIR